jgi:DNA repair photolyase
MLSFPLSSRNAMPRPVDNPSNPFLAQDIEWDAGEAPLARLHVHEEEARSILSENQSADLAFRYSINPYRGCQHACAYCYARPSHQRWGFGAGTDFERELVVKVNAPALLRQAFERRGWRGDPIALSGNTDCYQPLEARYGLTRALLSICAEYRNPVGVITKSPLVTRDIDVLGELARRARLIVYLSIPFADDAHRRALEPGAPSIERRFQALAALSEAGIETGVAVAPMIPGLNDSEIPTVLTRAREAGAKRAFLTLLRLPAEVREIFLERLESSLPLRAGKVERALREMRGGELNDPRFGSRMRGTGPRWQALHRLFEAQCRRLGYSNMTEERFAPAEAPGRATFERPRRQLTLLE